MSLAILPERGHKSLRLERAITGRPSRRVFEAHWVNEYWPPWQRWFARYDKEERNRRLDIILAELDQLNKEAQHGS